MEEIKEEKKGNLYFYLSLATKSPKVHKKKQKPVLKNVIKKIPKCEVITQSQMLKKRDQILTKMPIYEALYKGLIGNSSRREAEEARIKTLKKARSIPKKSPRKINSTSNMGNSTSCNDLT